MKPILYYLRRYKTATLLNLLGLSMALAAFYLFMTQVEYNNTFNQNLKDYQRTYRVEYWNDTKWANNLSADREKLWAQIAHIENTTSHAAWINQLEIKVNEHMYPITSYQVKKNALDFWGIQLLPGSDTWQDKPDGYILSESLARQIFGTENPIGKSFSIPQWGNDEKNIIGVCRDLPENCSFKNGLFQCYNENFSNDTRNWSAEIYLRLDHPENKHIVEQEMQNKFMTYFQITPEETTERFRLIPMDRVYFEGSGTEDKGNATLVYVLLAASIFVLIIGLLNFANFSLAQAPVRMRSINTRKVMSASTASLRWGLILENIFWSAIALTGAVLLILLFQKSPECMKLVSGNISFETHWSLVGFTLLSTLVIGVLSALFSAWYATSFPPALVLKGSFGLSPRGKMLRWTMLTVQFIIALTLTFYILVMTGQAHYIFNTDYGFNKDEVLYAKLPREAMSKKNYLKQEIAKLPFTQNSSFAADVLGNADKYMSWGRGNGESSISFNALCVDEFFLKTMDIKIAEGRDFNPHDQKGAYILNQAMVQKYPWIKLEQPINQNIDGWNSPEGFYPVVGICENYKLTSMRNDNNTIPAGFIIMGPDMTVNWGDRCKTIFVRIAKGYDKLEAKKQLEQLIKELDTEETCEFRFLDEDLQITYEEEFRFIAQVRFFAFICIFITLIGVFCLTLFETEYRRKEIAIRKIMGSTVHEVLLLFAGRYLIPLLIAFAIAAPIGYRLSMQWLQNFAEHTPIHWWFFPLTLLTVATIVLLTVVLQSWRVATENPVNSIKTE